MVVFLLNFYGYAIFRFSQCPSLQMNVCEPPLEEGRGCKESGEVAALLGHNLGSASALTSTWLAW